MPKKNFKYQAEKRLEKMCCFGTSKYKYKEEAKQMVRDNGTRDWLPIFNDLIRDKIFSYTTYKIYIKESNAFFGWIERTHPDVRNINGAKRYIGQYLDRCDSSWTAPTRISALAKVYGVPSTKLARVPKRKREDIVRSRIPTVREKTFSLEKNRELIDFCRNTGLRRFELEHLKGENLEERNGKYSLKVRGKGGKTRSIPITDKKVIEKMKNTPEKALVWGKVNSHAPIHTFRSEYATNLYNSLARDINNIPIKERYVCRKDMAGKSYDKKAMAEVSKRLGHERLSVIASHYLR